LNEVATHNREHPEDKRKLSIKDLFRFAKLDAREAGARLSPTFNQMTQSSGVDYVLDEPVKGYSADADAATDSIALFQEATGHELRVPKTLGGLLSGDAIYYRGERLPTSGAITRLISEAVAASRKATDPTTGEVLTEPPRVDIPELFDLANRAYQFKRTLRPKHSLVIEVDADGNVSPPRFDHNDEALLRLNPLIEEYKMTPVKIRGDSFQEGVKSAVEYMGSEKGGGQVLVGVMDNQLFFASPEMRKLFNTHRGIEGYKPGSLGADFNTLERRGVLLKK
jgi:hypothetical protein